MSDPVPPSGVTPESAGNGPLSAPSTGVFPGTPMAPADEGYRTLSITALIGFGIGAVYAVVLAWMALYSLFTGSPLHLDSWTFFFPAAAILLCLLARSWINSSEGTLAGEGLARWGLMLSLFVALCYGAYVTAISFAVRQQARTFADAWLEKLREQDRTKAALATLRPLDRLTLREDDPDLEHQISRQILMQAGGQMDTDPLTSFGRHPLVRLLLQGGKEVRFESKGVRSWEFTKGGYLVTLDYEIESPEGTYSALVTLHGSKAPHNEYQQRQWYIDFEKTAIDRQTNVPQISAFGERVQRINQDGRGFIYGWLSSLTDLNRNKSFLGTVSPNERVAAIKQLANGFRLSAALGPLMTSSAMEGGRILQTYQQFNAGETILIEAGALQGSTDQRAILTAVIRALLPGPPGLRVPLELAREIEPFRKVEGTHFRLSYDFQVGLKDQFAFTGILDLEGDAKALQEDQATPNWRILGIRIVSGKLLRPDVGGGKPRPGQPPRPGGS